MHGGRAAKKPASTLAESLANQDREREERQQKVVEGQKAHLQQLHDDGLRAADARADRVCRCRCGLTLVARTNWIDFKLMPTSPFQHADDRCNAEHGERDE